MLKDPLFQTIQHVILTGGEPTLRDDLKEITKLLVKYCTNLETISLTTNALIPTRAVTACEKIVEACKGRGIKFACSVSLDGLNEYHDKVRGVKNAFEKTIETLRILNQMKRTVGFGLSTESVISKANVENVYALEKWFKENNFQPHFSLATYRKRNLNDKMEFMIEGKYLNEYIAFLEHLRENGDWKYIYEFFWKALKQGKKRQILCPFAVEAVSVDPNGDMYFCTDSKSIGNIYEKTPSEIYYDEKNLRYRKHIQKTLCPECLQTCRMQTSLVKHPLVYINFLFRNHVHRRLISHKLANWKKSY
jgi:sulfatase maturation enzyme AslB (radical SAM superfamily)